MNAFCIRNDGSNLESLLKPRTLSQSKNDTFITTNSEKFKDLGQQQRLENISVDKNEYRHIRRIMDINNRTSIRVAADVTNSMTLNKDVVNRLKKYVNGKDLNGSYKRVSFEDCLNEEEEKQ